MNTHVSIENGIATREDGTTFNLNFTQGPWELRTIQRRGRTNWHISGPNSAGLQSAIAVVHDLAPDHDCPTQEANARLIAAAPELLAALQDISKLNGNLSVIDLGVPCGPREGAARGIKLRAALEIANHAIRHLITA